MYFFDIIELVKANSGRYRSLSVFDNRLFCDTEDGADAIRAYLELADKVEFDIKFFDADWCDIVEIQEKYEIFIKGCD